MGAFTRDRERGLVQPALRDELFRLTAAVTLFFAWLASAQPVAEPQWEVESGFAVIKDADGFWMPTAIAFVPNPGADPKDPLYFVTELRGKIKVVTVDRTVQTFADLADISFAYRPKDDRPWDEGQSGLAGICLSPKDGYVFATFVYRDSKGVLRNNMVRYQSIPGRFSLKPESWLAFTELFAEDESGFAHQIGCCDVVGDELYVGIGDGWQPFRTRQLDRLNGKVIRMTLEGKAIWDNPFNEHAFGEEATTGAGNFVWAYGLRNPFSLKVVENEVYVADNGINLDRFLKLERGKDYLWDGTDNSIAANAGYVWHPSVAPVQLDYCPSGFEAFPGEYWKSFYVAACGNGTPAPPAGIYILPYDREAGSLRAVPRYFLRHKGSGLFMSGLAFGPDGLYFAPLHDDGKSLSAIWKVVQAPHLDSFGSTLRLDASTLLRAKGCIGCHVIDGEGGHGGLAGPPLTRGRALADKLLLRLEDPAYRATLDSYPFGESGGTFSYRTVREDVLHANGFDKARVWLNYYLQDPLFDQQDRIQMPNLGLTEYEALTLANYLLEGAAPIAEARPSALRRIAELLLPSHPFRRRVVLYYFAGGLLLGAVAAYGVSKLRVYRGQSG